MPLIDGVDSFTAAHAPDLRREKAVEVTKHDLMAFCMDFNLPMFRMENVTFRDGIVEKKTNLNMLFTRFEGIWVMAYEDKLMELLHKLGFAEHPEKPLLYQKKVDENTTAYIDFRKEHSGSEKGRRFAVRGSDFIDDPDEIEILRQFKAERDKIFECEQERPRSAAKAPG